MELILQDCLAGKEGASILGKEGARSAGSTPLRQGLCLVEYSMQQNLNKSIVVTWFFYPR